MSNKKFAKKSHFEELDLENVWMTFKIKSKVVPSVRKNFPGKYKNRSLSCPSCRKNLSPISIPPADTQDHLVLERPTFADLRINKNMRDDKDLAEFFQQIIQYRSDNNEDKIEVIHPLGTCNED